MPAHFSDWHERLVPLLREAGAAIMQVYRQPQVHWQAKADASPVTQADLAAHRMSCWRSFCASARRSSSRSGNPGASTGCSTRWTAPKNFSPATANLP